MAYYSTESRSKRKQSRVLSNLIEMYALNNAHTVYRESDLLGPMQSSRSKSNAEFRFEVSIRLVKMFQSFFTSPFFLFEQSTKFQLNFNLLPMFLAWKRKENKSYA